MKNKYLLTVLLAGACHRSANDAEIMARGQNPDLTCESASTDRHNVQVAFCTATDKDKKTSQDFIAVYSKNHPFQAFKVATVAQAKAEQDAATKRAAQAQDAGVGSGSATTTGTGTGSGSGSAAKK